MRRPRPKFKVSFYSYFCCFWINVTQINFENIKRKIQRIISDTCFQLKSWFNGDARAPSIPLLNFPFKVTAKVYRLLRECVKLMILSVGWIHHARWWPLDTLLNISYPILNRNFNLIKKVVLLPQYLEVALKVPRNPNACWLLLIRSDVYTTYRLTLGYKCVSYIW